MSDYDTYDQDTYEAHSVLRGQDVGESLTEQYRDYTERRAAVLADYSASVA